MSKFLHILGLEKLSEEEVLLKFIQYNDHVLVVAPLVGKIPYRGYFKYLYDITLMVLVKRIKNKNITVIDIQADDMMKDPWGKSDLLTTKESMRQLDPKIKYVLADALNTPFPNDYFNIIMDRESSKFIVGIGASKILKNVFIDENKLEKLVYEYNRILKKGGKIIFFTSYHGGGLNEQLIRMLKVWRYKLRYGKLKSVKRFVIDNEEIIPIHQMEYYIIANKK